MRRNETWMFTQRFTVERSLMNKRGGTGRDEEKFKNKKGGMNRYELNASGIKESIWQVT